MKFTNFSNWLSHQNSIVNIKTLPITGQLGGINVIGLTLHQGVATIASPALKSTLMDQSNGANTSLQMQLQPRQPTLRNMEAFLPLNPQLLLGNL